MKNMIEQKGNSLHNPSFINSWQNIRADVENVETTHAILFAHKSATRVEKKMNTVQSNCPLKVWMNVTDAILSTVHLLLVKLKVASVLSQVSL